MKLSLVVVLAVIGLVSAQDTFDCFGNTCQSSNQYCYIDIHNQNGHCYTHHGNGHHEDHQACVGAHHPHSHCFCHTTQCVMDTAAGFTTAQPPTTATPTGTTDSGMTTMAPVGTTV